MDNPYILPVILQVIGLVIIIAEILIPSAGMLAVLAVSLFGYSLYSAFTDISVNAGITFVVIDMLLLPFVIGYGFKLLAKSPMALQKKLSKDDGIVVQSADSQELIGKEGEAFTDLRPSGIAIIDEQRLDVVTEGKYIDKGSKVVVVSVSGNQIIVHQTKS